MQLFTFYNKKPP